MAEEPKTIREELAEMRVELKWTKWLAAGALGASTVGQVTKLGPPTAIFDVILRLF